ncbi:flagella assembly protein j [Halobacteriales archaeon SW_7_68_16]|nr:MAG: flagella assembly protein j [Halobacteriales archaeon SW_7_68_16]
MGQLESDAVERLFLPAYEWLLADREDFVADVDRQLQAAHMTDVVELYLSRALGVGFVVGVLFWVAGVAVGTTLFARGVFVPGEVVVPDLLPGSIGESILALLSTVRTPALIGLTSLVIAFGGFLLGFGTYVLLPYYAAYGRRREINRLLPDAIAFMYALSSGGMGQVDVLEATAVADDTYGEVARELRGIAHEAQFAQTDYRSAIRNGVATTPSSQLSDFLTDYLSVLNSGGDPTAFLRERTDAYYEAAGQSRDEELDLLELLAELYVALSVMPVLLLVVLIVLSALQQPFPMVIAGIVYLGIPAVGAGFLVLVSLVTPDDAGDGLLRIDGETPTPTLSPRAESTIGEGLGVDDRPEFDVFGRIDRIEGSRQALAILRHPGQYFFEHPTRTLLVTVPAAATMIGSAALAGVIEISASALLTRPVETTAIIAFVPLYATLLPLAIFWEVHARSRRGVLGPLSLALRKLASTHDTGLSLVESMRVVADTTTGTLGREFERIYAKVNFGTPLRQALVEFNNRYRQPYLARIVRLIVEAQETSERITPVLTTAARASERREELRRGRRARTRIQVLIVLATFLALLAVLVVLDVRYVQVIANLDTDGTGRVGAPGIGGGFDPRFLSLALFHAGVVQGIISGLTAGYLRTGDVRSGAKYALGLSSIALAAFAIV